MPRPAVPDIALPILLALALVLLVAPSTQAVTYPNLLDELQHYAYTAYLATTGDLTPALHRIPQDSGVFYLNHPPGYYALMAPAYHVCSGDALCLRLANLPFAAAWIALVYLAGRRAGLRPVGASALAVLASASPVVAFMGGFINNDNLAFLAGALAAVALAPLIRGAPASWWLAAAAVAIAGLAKATALLAVGTLTALAAIALRRHLGTRDVLLLGAGFALAALPYIAFWIAYGDPVPNTRVLTGTLTPDADRHTEDAGVFIGYFLDRLATTMLEPVPVAPALAWVLAGLLWCAPALAAWRARGGTATALWIAVGAAVWLQTLIHLQHIWGYLGAVHFRYYAPLLPFLLLALVAALRPTALRPTALRPTGARGHAQPER